MTLPIALQLYTVREALATNLEGTLKELSNIGYRYVELAGTAGKTVAEFKALLAKYNLTPIAMHSSLVGLTADLPKTIQDAKAFGIKYLVCSFLTVPEREDYTKSASLLADAADKLEAQGLHLAYHNHSFEFDPTPQGQRGLDIIYNTTQGRKLQAELDIYWVQHGHDDPMKWMNKLNGRIPLLHVKDMDHTEKRGFAEVGTGTVDIKGAVALAPQVGVKYLIIEQDSSWINGSPLQSAKTSFNNLTAILAGK